MICLPNHLVLRMRFIIDDINEGLVSEVNICHIWKGRHIINIITITLCLRFTYYTQFIIIYIYLNPFTIGMTVDRYFFEFHNIACKCACFVREDVLNLPEFFVKVGTLNVSGCDDNLSFIILASEHHILIHADNYRLKEFYHLQRYK